MRKERDSKTSAAIDGIAGWGSTSSNQLRPHTSNGWAGFAQTLYSGGSFSLDVASDREPSSLGIRERSRARPWIETNECLGRDCLDDLSKFVVVSSRGTGYVAFNHGTGVRFPVPLPIPNGGGVVSRVF